MDTTIERLIELLDLESIEENIFAVKVKTSEAHKYLVVKCWGKHSPLPAEL